MTKSFSVPANWHQTFFTGPVMRFWDAAIPPQATQADVTFIMRHIAASPPARVADVPCGTGRHAIALAQAGFNVTAVDASLAAIERARAAAVDSPTVNFERSDMLAFNTDAQFDALICMGNSIGYDEPPTIVTLLERFSSALRTGGRLILDTGICAESLLPIAAERRLVFPGGWFEQEITYDASASIINTARSS